MQINISLKGYRTYIAAGLTGVFGVLATLDWTGILDGHPEAGWTAIIVSLLMAVMRTLTTTPPLQSEHKKEN